MKRKPKPTDWHHRPAQTSGTVCEVCGLPAHHDGEHRAVDNPGHRWEIRRKANGREIVIAVGRIPKPKVIKPKSTAKDRSPVVANLQQIAALFALGKSYPEIDEALKLPKRTAETVTMPNCRALWEATLAKAMEGTIALVRATAGTAAVLDDPEGHVNRAMRALDYCGAKGQALFVATAQTTLTALYTGHYKVVRLGDAKESTLRWHSYVLKFWVAITGDPAIEAITPATLALFRDTIMKTRGANTCRGYLAFIQGVLDRAGPQRERMRDALGIVDRTAWAKPPRKMVRQKPPADTAHVVAMYKAADELAVPALEGVRPGAWWRALIVLLSTTGLRLGSVKALRWSWINWRTGTLTVPAEAMKTGVELRLPLLPVCLAHLRKIKTDRELIFEGFLWNRAFFLQWNKLQAFAKVPTAERFGTHGVRRRLATLLWEYDPAAAQLALGHASMAVTRERYVRAEGIIGAALKRLTQPEAFEKGGGT